MKQQWHDITSAGWINWQKCRTNRTYYIVFGTLPKRINPYLCIVDDFGLLVRV